MRPEDWFNAYTHTYDYFGDDEDDAHIFINSFLYLLEEFL